MTKISIGISGPWVLPKKNVPTAVGACGSGLFLNPLNEAYMDSVAATDVLHLPSHSYKFPESPRFPAYFNLMKQEFVSARYRLYQATQGIAPKFVMRDVLMLDSGEGQVLGHLTEELRSAFRAAYAIFDKNRSLLERLLSDWNQCPKRDLSPRLVQKAKQRSLRASTNVRGESQLDATGSVLRVK